MAAIAALAGGEPLFPSGFPKGFRIGIGGDLDAVARKDACGSVAHQALLRTRPETGSDAGPPVTSANSQSSTWLTVVPRTCSTPSTM